jgi:hypothetical protein
MKRISLLLLLAVTLCAGCATRYNITLNNGDIVTAKGKPKYDKQRNGFFYTDALGNTNYISAFRVREIAPASSSKSDNSGFLPTEFRK